MIYDFSYLKPGPEVYRIKHDPFYIVHGEGKKHVRKIFYNVDYDEYELKMMAEFEALIQQNNIQLPSDWTKELTLKYCYSGGFDLPRCLERLQKHLEWRKDPVYQVTTPEAMEYIKNGYCYLFGRDHQFRPVIYIQVHLMNKLKLNVITLLNAATTLSRIVIEHMYVKGIVENWVVVLDTAGSGLFDTPFHTLKLINDTLGINFTSSLHKMFILNPSFIFSSSWKLIEKIIHPETAQKINFVRPSEYHKIHEVIPPAEIEQKYGGTHPNLTEFWPILNTRGPNQINDELSRPPNSKMLDSEYFSIANNSREFFSQAKNNNRIHEQFIEYHQSEAQQCCTCNIM